MKNSLFISLSSLIMLLGSTVGLADDDGRKKRIRSFVGLWETVDPLDGSLTQRSITCDWRTGTCEILGSDSFWAFCGSARGILRGEGTLEDGELRVPEFMLTCMETGEELVVDTTFVLDRKKRILLEKHANPPIPTFFFHKTSR